MILLFLACTDPALAPYQEALSNYDAGRKALDGGDPKEAAALFAKARQGDPASVSLRMWEAKALVASGDLAGADARMTELIKEQPDLGIAWYNRAAWRVRAGRYLEGAQDLQKALELREGSALQAAGDPDFVAVRTRPEFASFLPDHTLLGEIKGPTGSVFVGSRVELTIRLLSLPGEEPVMRRAGADPGCLLPVKLLEDRQEGTGEVIRSLVFSFTAVRACNGELGPFSFTTPSKTLLLDAVPIVVEAPSSANSVPSPPPLPETLPLPGALVLGTPMQDASGMAVLLEPGSPLPRSRRPDLSLELRKAGQTLAIGGWWRP